MSNTRRVAYNTFAQAGGRLLVTGLGVVSVGLTTRYLGVDVYGQLTTAVLFVALFTSLSEAGITVTTIRELTHDEASWDEIVGNVLTLRLLAGAVLAAITIGAGHLVYGDVSHHRVALAIDYLVVTTVLAAVQTSITTTLSAKLRNDLVVVGAVLGRLVSLAGIIFVISYNLGYVGLVETTVAGAAVNLVSDAIFSLRRFRLRLRLRFDVTYWRYITLLAAPIGVASIINTVYLKLDGVLLSLLRSSEEVALYGVAYRLMDLLMAFPQFLSTSVFPLLAAAKNDPERLKQLTDRTIQVLDMVAAPLVVGAAVVSEQLAVLLGGRSFRDAALPMAILATGNLFLYANTGYSAALFAIGAQKQMLWTISVTFVVNIAANAVAIPAFGAPGAAGSVVLSEAVGLTLVRRIYRRELGVDSQPRRLWAYVGVSLIMGAVVVAAKDVLFASPNVWNLLAITAVGGVSYYGLLRAFGLLAAGELRAVIKRR